MAKGQWEFSFRLALLEEGARMPDVSYVALNDRILPVAEATLPATSEGVRFGSGCFETIAVTGGQPRFWERHIGRFSRSCERIGITPKVSPVRLRELLKELVCLCGIEDGVLRLSSHQEGAVANTVLTLSPPRYTTAPQSLRLGLSPFRHPCVNALSGIKHNNYGFYLGAHAEAASRGFDEAVFVGTTGDLLEGSRTNVFILMRAATAETTAAGFTTSLPAVGEKRHAHTSPWRICTAPLAAGVLPGVMRSLVADVAAGCDCDFIEGAFTPADAKRAEACFVSNALLGVVPVAELDGHCFDLEAEACSVVRSLNAAIASLGE